MKYAIIDIETTGLNPKRDRVTEVAILVHDGEKITDEFITLVNPEMRIPYRIRELTGISDSMVAMAPTFCEIAREIVEITRDCIFVAHNVHFDYHFIREEFQRLFYNYERQCLCTKRLSRKLLPGLKSYSLGNLCNSLNIRIDNRHRAFGDARATVKVFEQLLQLEKHPETISLRGIRTHIPDEKLSSLPEKTGVYYFYNEEGSIIYIGKSINIKERVLSHFSSPVTKRASEMQDQIHDVGYEICGSELIALLMESEEVKKHTPRFNRLLRRKWLQWGIFAGENEQGYTTLGIRRNDNHETPLTTFSTKKQARDFLFSLTGQYELCQKLCGLYKSKGTCFQYHIQRCKGACIQEEPPETYNLRVAEATAPWRYGKNSFFIIDSGRNPDEKSVVLIDNNRYCGYGFFPANDCIHDEDELRGYINARPDHRDAHQIIRLYLKQNKAERII